MFFGRVETVGSWESTKRARKGKRRRGRGGLSLAREKSTTAKGQKESQKPRSGRGGNLKKKEPLVREAARKHLSKQKV